MKRSSLLMLAAFIAGMPATSVAQDFPARQMTIIVPFAPGGSADIVARIYAQKLTERLGKPVVVENRAGAGTVVGALAAARAAPDGYTLFMGGSSALAYNPTLHKQLPYDPAKDFVPLAHVASIPFILVVQPSLPVTDLKSLIDYAKKNSAKMTYASGGIGLLNHLAMEQFRGAAGFEAVVAHYRGIGPAINDFLANQTMMMMPGLAAALPHIRAGKMRPLAITGLKRHALAPEVPTFEESGFKGFDGVQWYGIVGPAKLPADITRRLNAEINKSLASPALQQRLSAEAIDPMPMTPEQFGKFIQADIARWSALARERKISLDD